MEADGKESTQSARGVFIKKKGIEGDEWQTVQSGTKGFPLYLHVYMWLLTYVIYVS